jgi:hypothetical protein
MRCAVAVLVAAALAVIVTVALIRASKGVPPEPPPVSPVAPQSPRGVFTRGRDAFAQVGLVESGGKDAVALFGRATRRGGDRWNYYAVSNARNPQRLPVFVAGRDCAKPLGCAEIGDGDAVDVRGYGASTATVYTRDTC